VTADLPNCCSASSHATKELEKPLDFGHAQEGLEGKEERFVLVVLTVTCLPELTVFYAAAQREKQAQAALNNSLDEGVHRSTAGHEDPTGNDAGPSGRVQAHEDASVQPRAGLRANGARSTRLRNQSVRFELQDGMLCS